MKRLIIFLAIGGLQALKAIQYVRMFGNMNAGGQGQYNPYSGQYGQYGNGMYNGYNSYGNS
jgi:hypothetical protein